MQTKQANAIKLLPLYTEETGVIIGCLLGDGTLSEAGKHYRLRIEHTVKHREYVLWKYLMLKRLVHSEPTFLKTHNSMRFGTVGHPDLTKMRKVWYVSGRKRVPISLKTLSAISIAVWFMDDGTKHRDTVDFSVHNFRKSDIVRLQKIFRKYKVQTTINSDGKGSRLYVLKRSYPAFKRLVKPYIVKCMAYKLP
jgi:hypothetical protein